MRRLFELNEDGLTLTDALIALGFLAIVVFVVFRIKGIQAAPTDIQTLETACVSSFATCQSGLSVALQRALGVFVL